MKKYNKPAIQVVELSVKESLSALPTGFARTGMGKLSGAKYRNISIYRTNSSAGTSTTKADI